MRFKEWELLLILMFLIVLSISAMYFAVEGGRTKNDIMRVEIDGEVTLRYPFIIYKGEVYQMTDQINWEGIEK